MNISVNFHIFGADPSQRVANSDDSQLAGVIYCLSPHSTLLFLCLYLYFRFILFLVCILASVAETWP